MEEKKKKHSIWASLQLVFQSYRTAPQPLLLVSSQAQKITYIFYRTYFPAHCLQVHHTKPLIISDIGVWQWLDNDLYINTWIFSLMFFFSSYCGRYSRSEYTAFLEFPGQRNTMWPILCVSSWIEASDPSLADGIFIFIWQKVHNSQDLNQKLNQPSYFQVVTQKNCKIVANHSYEAVSERQTLYRLKSLHSFLSLFLPILLWSDKILPMYLPVT